MRPRTPFRWAGGAAGIAPVALVALALRLAWALHYAARFRAGALGVLPFLFEPGNIARALALGHGFASPLRVPSGPTAWVAPVYPLILAGCFRLFGLYATNAYAAAVGINIAASAATVFPVQALGRRLGGRWVGAAAAWLWAVYPNAILLPSESLWDASLTALLAACALAWTLRLGEAAGARDGDWEWAGYGALWALVLMTNPALLSVLLFCFAWLVWRGRRAGSTPQRGTRPARHLGLAALVLCLGCLPWTLRNWEALHAFVPFRSDLGLALWLGNNPSAGKVPLGEMHPINNGAERAAYLRLGEVAYMRAKLRAALGYMRRHPERTAALIPGRFLAFWSGGDPRPWRDWPRGSAWFRFVVVFDLLAGLGALAGLALLIVRRDTLWLPFAALVVVFPSAYYLTAALPRYRLPCDPAILALAAAALAGFGRGRSRHPAALTARAPGASGNP